MARPPQSGGYWVGEGGTVGIPVRRKDDSPADTPAKFQWRVNRTGGAGNPAEAADFKNGDIPASEGDIEVPAGTTEVTIAIAIASDADTDAEETFIVELLPPDDADANTFIVQPSGPRDYPGDRRQVIIGASDGPADASGPVTLFMARPPQSGGYWVGEGGTVGIPVRRTDDSPVDVAAKFRWTVNRTSGGGDGRGGDRAHGAGAFGRRRRGLSFGGQSSLAGFLTAHRDAINEGGISWTELLGRSSFELPLAGLRSGAGGGLDAGRLLFGQSFAPGAAAGGGMYRPDPDADPPRAGQRVARAAAPGSGSGAGGGAGEAPHAPRPGDVTLWGSGHYRPLSGDSGAVDWDGSLAGFYLGADTRLGDDLLAGLAVSWSGSDLDYT